MKKAAQKNEPMNILVLADHESKYLYDYYEPEKLKDVDLIISCGDLEANYLSFFATFCHVPVLYVMGNHDRGYELKPPEGCICIEDDILVSHAPAYKVNDLEDLPHRGFDCFRTLMEKYEPKLFCHGHVHATYGTGFKRRDTYGKTTVINGYEYYIVEYP